MARAQELRLGFGVGNAWGWLRASGFRCNPPVGDLLLYENPIERLVSHQIRENPKKPLVSGFLGSNAGTSFHYFLCLPPPRTQVGAGSTTVLPSSVTAVWASSLPLIEAPVASVIAV